MAYRGISTTTAPSHRRVGIAAVQDCCDQYPGAAEEFHSLCRGAVARAGTKAAPVKPINTLIPPC